MRKRIPWLVVAAALTGACGCSSRTNSTDWPSPALSPSDVVRIQVLALQHANEPQPNAGIWTAFHFASPANHRVTGSYGHFLQVIKSPANKPFLHARSVSFHAPRQMDQQAEEIVDLTDENGHISSWVFSLSKQSAGTFAGCWMTDGVDAEPER